MKEGDVVLTPLPQADGRLKSRPALVLREMPGYGDLLVCGISTQLRQRIPGFDELISPSDGDFAASGLVTESLVRLAFLAVLPKSRIAGAIGAVSPRRHRRLLKRPSDHLLRQGAP
jgi:mRNA interferase MazF